MAKVKIAVCHDSMTMDSPLTSRASKASLSPPVGTSTRHRVRLLRRPRRRACRSVLQDFKLAQMNYRKDRDISVLLETLQLAQDALWTQPRELASQLIGRIHGYGSLTGTMIRQARELIRTTRDAEQRAYVTTVVQMLELLTEYMDRKNEVRGAAWNGVGRGRQGMG